MTIENAARAETILFAGTAVDVLLPSAVTDGAFALLHIVNPPGCWTPQHRHQFEDETVYVLSGTMRAQTPTGASDLGPGQAMMLPRGQAHQLGNAGAEEARLLVLCTPGNFDAFVRAAGRPASAGDTLAMTEADVARLMQAAPRYGIELLPPDAAIPATVVTVSGHGVSDVLDVLGVSIEMLAETGGNADDVCLLRGHFPAAAELPWHSHTDRKAIYVLDGALDIAMGNAGAASWTTVSTGGTAYVPAHRPHAIRNRGTAPATALLIATRRIADLFREVGLTLGTSPLGSPSPNRPDTFITAAQERGFVLGEIRK